MADEKDLEEYRKNNPGASAHLEDGKIIVEGVGSGAAHAPVGSQSPLAKKLEDAQVAAVKAAMEDGVPLNESSTILEYKSHYRAAVLDESMRPQIDELRARTKERLGQKKAE